MFPIKTKKLNNNEIMKVVIEDFGKCLRKISLRTRDLSKKINIMFSEYYRLVENTYGFYIKGIGISCPDKEDSFDEEIGNEISFRKAKLNANLKKAKILKRALKMYKEEEDSIKTELDKLNKYIDMDLTALRKYNPDYLTDYEV